MLTEIKAEQCQNYDAFW